jgi:hypothetical protein
MINPFDAEDHVLRRLPIQIRSDRTPGVDPLCDELMHAITDIADHRDRPHPDSSCVWGALGVPGAFDAHDVWWVYRKDAELRRGKRAGQQNSAAP